MSRARETSLYCYSIEYASSTNEVIAAIARLLAELKRTGVLALLPDSLQGLVAENGAEIDAELAALRRARAEKAPLSAAQRFWIDEIEAVFETASRRLAQPGAMREPARSGLGSAFERNGGPGTPKGAPAAAPHRRPVSRRQGQ